MRRFLVVACLAVLLTAAESRAATFASVGLYQSVDQLNTWATTFAAANSDIVRLVEYGRSAQDRPLLALEITEQPGVVNSAKADFLFTGGLHAREVIGSESMYRLAEHLVQGYRAADPACVAALQQRDIWIVPNQNPDGRVSVELGISQQRKNMELYPGQNANNYTRGVDLNRNFPHRWADASSLVADETYRGPAVLSAPEASSLWSLLHDTTKFDNFLAAIDFHSGAKTILSPWLSRGDTLNPPPPPIRAQFDALAGHMGQLTGLSTQRLGYNSYGTLTDSLYEEFGAYALTVELYSASGDYFTLFNPITQSTRDATVNKAIVSSMYMLSAKAFPVPEPSVVVLLIAGLAGLACWRRLRGVPTPR